MAGVGFFTDSYDEPLLLLRDTDAETNKLFILAMIFSRLPS